MIIGISMALETCLILGQVSHNLLYWKKKLPTDFCGPERDWRENSLHPGQIIYGQNSGNQWESTPSWRRSKSGLMKSSILKTLEKCEGSISSTLRIRNLKKPSRTRVRSWKHQWLLLCLVKLWKIVGVVHPTKLKQNLRVFWKLMNLQECVWEIRYRIIMKTILQEKETIHYSTTIWFTKKFLCLDKEWEKLEKISAWNLTKVRSKKEVIDEARSADATVHFASLMDICHLKNAELEAEHQKYKGRVVLRGEIVKDDSGSYAVFTEQGSSASQMTAAKIMDIISRLPGCDGQAADAVSAYTQVKWKMLANYWKFQNRSVQTFGFVYHDTNGQNHGPVRKTQLFLSNGICMVILLQDYCGKGNLRKSYWNMAGRKFPNWECLFVHREKGLFLSVYVDDIKLAGKKQNLDPMWKLLNKEVDLGEPTSFLDHVYLGCTQRQCENKQRYCGPLQNHVRIANFSGENRKTTISSKSSYFFIVLWYGWLCKEMCGAILWVSQQVYTTTLQSIYSMHRWPSL